MKRLVFGYIFLAICGLFCVGLGRPTIARAATPTYSIPNPPNERLKDFSVIEDHGTWHAFAMSVCVSAPCTRPYSVIWHYVSRDLHTWTNLGIALAPRSGTIDSGDVWAPSVVGADGQWTMFYTAVQYQGNTPIQRIAVATSNDLQTWNRQTNNLVLDCDSLSWAYWNLSDTQGIGGECRDPYVAWDNVSQRWLMTVSTRMTDVWGAHPMVIGQLWSNDLQAWNEIGSIPATIGWTAESSHFVRNDNKNYIFWTKCPSGGTCLQWASASTMQGSFSTAQPVIGLETWAYASEAISIGERVGFFHVGMGVTEREVRFPSDVPTVNPLELGTLEVTSSVTIPGISTSSAPGLPGASFLVYREQNGQGWGASEDLFLYSVQSDASGKVRLTLPPGSYWLVSDENDYLPGHVLAAYAPESYVSPVVINWSDRLTTDWTVTVAPRRWNVGSQTTTVQRSAVPFSAASSVGTPFTSIHDVSIVGLGVEDASMMLSNDDGQTWWSLENSLWVEKPLAVEFAVPVSELDAHLSSFPIGVGQLRWQLFHSETAVPVTVDISLDGAPTTPTMLTPTDGGTVSSLKPAFGMQGSDPDGSSLVYVLQYCGATCTTVESQISEAQWIGLQNGLAVSGSNVRWQPLTSIGNGAMQWRIRTVDSGGSATWSDWSDWSTIHLPPAAQVTSSVRVISLDSVEITWNTVTPSTAYLYYTDEFDHEFISEQVALRGQHIVTDLQLGAVYDFWISTTDIYGQNVSTHVIQQLPTQATTITDSSIWADSAGIHIAWQTNGPSTGGVRHGAQASMTEYSAATENGTTHSLLISGYTAGQTVYYQIIGQGGTQYESTVASYILPNAPVLYELPTEPDPLPILRPMRELRRPR